MAQTIFPHRVIPAGVVTADVWSSIDSHGARTLISGHLSDFDAATALKLERVVRADLELVRRKCGLLPEDRVAVVAQWHSVHTELRGTGKPVDLGADNQAEIALEIPAGRSGGALVLRTCVVLAVPTSSLERHPFSAALPGTILWQDRIDVALEGVGPRFPVEVRRFDSPQLAAMGWLLDWRPSSPELTFLGSVRLLLNENNPRVVEAAKSATRDAGQKAIVSAINVDVARSLISGLLRNPDFTQAEHRYEPGTVGQVVGDLIASTFPSEDLRTVAMQLENEPETFAAKIQSRFKIFSD